MSWLTYTGKKPLPKRKKNYDQVLMKLAHLWAEESHCKRLKVGVIIARDGRSIMSGYNGTPKGSDNQCETAENVTKQNVVHAEINALLFCAKHGLRTNNATLYVTHATCKACAASIFHAGITRVVYNQDYRDMEGINELRFYGVRVDKLNSGTN